MKDQNRNGGEGAGVFVEQDEKVQPYFVLLLLFFSSAGDVDRIDVILDKSGSVSR